MLKQSWWMVHVGVGQIIIYMVPFLLIGHHLMHASVLPGGLSGVSRKAIRRVYLALLMITMLAAMVMAGRIVVHTILFPPGWDFQGLWLYGHVLDAGQNPYLPASYPALAGPGPFVQDFREAVLNVGSVYPPPSLLMFAAVGWLPLQVAIIPWMAVQMAAFVAMIILLGRIFLTGARWEGLLLILSITLLLPGTLATFGHGQINFIAVLCLLLAWRSKDRAVTGMYLVVAAIVKLLYGFLWLYPVLRRKWPPLVGIAIGSAVAVLATIAAFGWKIFSTYLFNNPVTHRFPSYYLGSPVSQSLLGASLRLFPYHGAPFGPPVGHPAYVASAVLVGLITVWAVARQPRTSQGEDTAFVLLILAGMLIYPWTLSNYFVLLMIPIGFLWSRRTSAIPGLFWTILLISSIYPITYYRNGLYAIVATILLWTTIVIIAVKQIPVAGARGAEASEGIPLVALDGKT